ncbi:MAG: hypothetical protein PW789_08230 [Edaphobacter sp.]|uniref:hypothetical protein n=1 Tax=Edaphobacter sp. TaxID=1934404 RepID=UPI0023A57B7E|nr:hypothetical protein [Edaphobacter sp.]MDE1176582.1 hypothetical protein [Edaphobacter sp.]
MAVRSAKRIAMARSSDKKMMENANQNAGIQLRAMAIPAANESAATSSGMRRRRSGSIVVA